MGKCLICKAPFKGRADKKFCSIDCKNSYHLQLKKANELATAKVDLLLHRNREILLETLGKDGKQKILSKIELEKKGFVFRYITGYYTNSQGKQYHYVYDFAWMEFTSQEVLIVRAGAKG
jgi:hypothetical protein